MRTSRDFKFNDNNELTDGLIMLTDSKFVEETNNDSKFALLNKIDIPKEVERIINIGLIQFSMVDVYRNEDGVEVLSNRHSRVLYDSDEEYESFKKVGKSCELEYIMISPLYHSKGLGKLLMKEMKNALNNNIEIDNIYLTVSPLDNNEMSHLEGVSESKEGNETFITNDNLVKYYQKLGFDFYINHTNNKNYMKVSFDEFKKNFNQTKKIINNNKNNKR